MNENEQILRAKTIMTRLVTEKIPQAAHWSVPGEFKSWIDGLNDRDFKIYLDRLRVLTRNLSDEELPQKAGIFMAGKAYSMDKMEMKRRLDLVGGEATAYYALAVWRALEAEKLVHELS